VALQEKRGIKVSWIFGFGVALVISLLSMPVIIGIARRYGLYDKVDERKIHSGSIPRLGGLGIIFSFLASIVVMTVLSGKGVSTGGRFWGVVIGFLIIHLLGLVDDFRNLRARAKLLVEFVTAVGLVFLDFRFKTIMLPFSSGQIELGAVSYPLTVLWIIGITNAMNLIDGMDGLSGGISSIVALVFGVFFATKGNVGGALVCFAIVGAILGFLAFNLPPAKIFMGDSGSLALGFLLAALPLIGPASGVIEIGFLSAVTVLLIPIYDTFSAIIRRKSAGVSFFSPDRNHIHHKLLSLGLTVGKSLVVVFAAQILLGLVALSTIFLPSTMSFFLKVMSWLLFGGLFLLVSLLARRRAGQSGELGTKLEADRAQPARRDSYKKYRRAAAIGTVAAGNTNGLDDPKGNRSGPKKLQ
jgi:UDP-GlcNAc:undecaprenyl-phosphate GlcNAc-1-phosphate transferase